MIGRPIYLVLLMACAALPTFVTGCAGGDADHRTPVAASSCPLSKSGSALTMTLPASCSFDRVDTAADPDAHDLWGDYACVPRQVGWVPAGGDRAPTVTGAPQANRAFRELTVMDGDDPNGDGERCELGTNSWTDGIAGPRNPAGTFYNYNEGDRRATYASIRLPSNFPIGTGEWQNGLQMKQSGPSNGSSGTPMLSLKIFRNRFRLFHTPTYSEGPDTQLWSPDPGATPRATPRAGVWYRIAIDADYSKNPSVGWVKMYLDLNGDGDFDDPQEQSPAFSGSALGGTLKTEPAPDPGNPDIPGNGADIGPPTGDPIPSHLRAGIYHNPVIACPGGCSVDLDNVEVVAP
jgi:Polysaccharide lyase